MKKKMKLMIAALLIIAVAGGFAWQINAPLKVETFQISEEYTEIYFTEDGTVTLTDYYSVYAPVTAKIDRIDVKTDDKVKAGDVIAQLDTTDLQRQIQVHKNNIAAYSAQIGETKTGESNTKDDFSASLNQLYAKKAQIEAEMKVTDTSNVNQILPEENLAILQSNIEQSEKDTAYYENLFEMQKLLYESGGLTKAELDETELLLKNAQTKLEQYKEQESASRQELGRLQEKYGDTADINSLNAQGRAEQYEAMLNEVEAQIASLQSNMGKNYSGDMIQYYEAMIKNEETSIAILEDKITDCTVTADTDGVVYELPIKNATMAYEQGVICVIKPADTYKVESYVSTDDVVTLNVGDRVELIQKTRDEDITYEGVIDNIADWAEENISPLGLIEYKVKVIIIPQEEMISAGEGYGLDVKYIYYREENSITVPKSALFEYENTDYVFVEEDGAAVKRAVSKGPSSTTRTVILEGLNAGDRVVKYSSGEGLGEGVKIKY